MLMPKILSGESVLPNPSRSIAQRGWFSAKSYGVLYEQLNS